MADTISVYSTVTQADGFKAEVVDSTLLGTRYFPNREGDNFAGKEVLFDFDSEDLEKGAFLTSGYKAGNTTTWISNSVVPPRVADRDSVDPKDLDRQLFERLCRAQGADLNRAQAFQDLAVIKASRLAKRIDRAIELLASLVLSEGKIEFDQDKDESGSDTDHIVCKFYDPTKGANNHFVSGTAWGSSSAHPYEDVCEMVNNMILHGKRPVDLLLGASAWANLAKDETFKAFAGTTYHSEGMMIDFGEIDGAQHVAKSVFNGVQLNVIVYIAGYKASDGTMKHFIDPNAAILISGEIGRTLCGGVTLLNDNVSYDLDNSFMDLKGKYIEHLYKDFNAQKLYIRSESRPMPAPKHSVNDLDWIYCDTSMSISGGAFGEVAKGVAFVQDEDLTWATNCSCSATVAISGSEVTITQGTVTGKTVKLYALRDGKKSGEALTVLSNKIILPADCDRDSDGKALIFATAV